MSANFIVEPKSVLHNPDASVLRDLVANMPNATKTEFGNYNVAVKVTARSKASTYIVDDDPTQHSDQTISRADYDKMAALQNEYIKGCDMIVIDANLAPKTLETVFSLARKYNRPVCVDPTSALLAPRVRPHMSDIYLLVPNLREAEVLTELQLGEQTDVHSMASKLVHMGVENDISHLMGY